MAVKDTSTGKYQIIGVLPLTNTMFARDAEGKVIRENGKPKRVTDESLVEFKRRLTEA
jgi:hypothetical protein